MTEVSRPSRRLLLAGLAAAPWVTLQPAQAAPQFQRSSLTIVTAGGERHRFQVELAVTPEERGHGLMFREELADDGGMLFLFEGLQPASMWMRNTLIPLDMLFLAADGRVVVIAERTEPLSERVISSGAPVKAVLELKGGTSERLGLAPGDQVRHSLLLP